MTLITVAIIAAIAIAAAEIAVGWYFVARNGESGKFETEAARDVRLAEKDYLAEARDDLTEPVAPRYGSDPQARASIDSEPKSVRPLGLRVTPTDLQAAYEDVMPRHPWRSLPLEPGLEDLYPLYEQKGVNVVRSVEDILRDLPAAAPRLTDTQEIRFDALMGSTWTSDERAALLNGPDWKCESCTTGRDGEPPHTSCVGCSCRCGDSQGAQIIPLGNPARLERRAA